MTKRAFRQAAVAALAVFATGEAAVGQIEGRVEHRYADSDGVRIHYVTTGEGPLVVLIHGFPDFWYSWRHQMAGLRDRFQVVAIDQRGYNRSGQPQGIASYDMSLLVDDVAAVIDDLGRDRATIVGHDWGGAVAWNVAFTRPELVEHLIILDLPHPNGLARAWARNDEALAGTAYARAFREGRPDDPDIFFGRPMTPETLSGWVRDREARARYVEAFERSSFEGMLNYYKQNYPDLWGDPAGAESLGPADPPPVASLAPEDPPPVAVPTLVFHGLQDQALHSDALNNTWDWVDADLTLVTVPDAGHFIQQDAAELVTRTMRWWLLARTTR